MKLSTLLICTAILALAGCQEVNEQVNIDLEFVQHQATGMCFATYRLGSEYGALSQVQCTPEVLALINNQPVASPVAKETIR